MRLFIRLLLVPGVVGWLFGGCSERIEPKPLTYTQLLTGTEKKTWKLVSAQIFDEGQSDGVIPVSQLGINPCIADDFCTFYANAERKFEASEGPLKCSPTDPDVYVTDNWTLVNANATLEFYLPLVNDKLPWTIKTLTERVLTIEYYFPDIDASYRFTLNPTTTR
jgi:hypothetical protein